MRPRRWKIPTSKVYPEPLKRYLQVYDKFEAKPKCTWLEIIDQIPYYKGKYAAAKTEKEVNVVKAELFDDRKEAEKIIKNAKKGIFSR